ncbi:MULTISPECIES: phage recombination protein Bet [Streptomyces]|uniref:Phage recombination protein Bet n=1 Tax=Streptomyces dengpaensis TaxID=2049881 RepID=A0ABN5I5R8_9ACTN|nr:MULTISPECIES: phage recombination protein Bet [Streptomyces]AVH58413.1 phage recombination protein Bet [Streptomyces dengpaensis]PIB06086.1 phage recombination protein Bet [Streptomyces sp. HG99]
MTVTTLPAARLAPAPAPHGGALAVRVDQTAWTPEQAAVLRQSGIKDQVTAAELAGFLHLCQRTGLDPFSRQIYLIGRWSKKDNRDVYTPQTGIDGYRVIAQRVTTQTGGTYGYEDTVWCDPSGRWRDVWLPEAPPAAAKVTVIRNGERFSAVATFREYVQTFPDGNPKGLWAKMPAGQIAKCAEALALRKAFPHDLAGVYTAEEMAQADNTDSAPVVVEQQPRRSQHAESGPWEQEAPPQQQERRDYRAEAQAAEDADTVRGLWQEAKRAGAPTEYLDQIAAIGRDRAEIDATIVVADDGYRTMDQDDAEQYAEVRAHAEAENALRLAASRANLPTLDADFQRVYGLPIEQAPAQQLDTFRAQIEAAAGGAQ